MKQTAGQLQKPQAVVFDMDGTLFKTETLILPAYHGVFDRLRAEGLYQGETPPEQLMLGSLGMLLEDIWKNVMPDADPAAHHRANELLLELELSGLKTEATELYPDVAETLAGLKERGVQLYVASNGLEHYVKGVAEAHGIATLFDGLFSAGEHQTCSKADLLRLLMKQHDLSTVWMVGDRSSDVEAGKQNGQTVIGCRYAGFGDDHELEGSDVIIREFKQLLPLYDGAKE